MLALLHGAEEIKQQNRATAFLNVCMLLKASSIVQMAVERGLEGALADLIWQAMLRAEDAVLSSL